MEVTIKGLEFLEQYGYYIDHNTVEIGEIIGYGVDRGVMYKGYEIRAHPYLTESGEWTTNIYISLDKGSKVTERNFSADNTFETKEETIQCCFNFGRQIVDGRIENCSIDDL